MNPFCTPIARSVATAGPVPYECSTFAEKTGRDSGTRPRRHRGTNYATKAPNGDPPGAIVADNLSGTPAGTWSSSTSVGGYYGTNYQTHAAGTGTHTFAWSLSAPGTGSYEVYARWTAQGNRVLVRGSD